MIKLHYMLNVSHSNENVLQDFLFPFNSYNFRPQITSHFGISSLTKLPKN